MSARGPDLGGHQPSEVDQRGFGLSAFVRGNGSRLSQLLHDGPVEQLERDAELVAEISVGPLDAWRGSREVVEQRQRQGTSIDTTVLDCDASTRLDAHAAFKPMGSAITPTMQYRRRKRWLAIHAGVYVIVNGLFIGQWLLLRDEPIKDVDPRVLESFWPVWLMLLWGAILGIHGLYVWSRKPLDDVPPPGPASWRTGRMVRTVVFTDIVGSTERAQEMGDRRWKEVLGRHDRLGDELAKRFRGRVMKHRGDGQLAVFETPNEAIRFAESLRSELRSVGLDVRAGMHSGEVDLQRRDVAGIGVHIASRVMGAAQPSQILVSRTVRDLVSGSDIAFTDAGTHTLKGLEGEWHLFSVSDGAETRGVSA